MNEIAGQQVRGPAQPSPYVDRRALSEAWYSALYDSRHAPAGRSAAARTDAEAHEAKPVASRPGSAAPLHGTTAKAAPAKAVRFRLIRAALATDARARAVKTPAESAVRAGVRRAVWRRTLCRTSLPSGQAVDLLVQQRGDLLRLIAIYDGRDAGRVSAGLLRARAALVQRALRVELDARQKGTS